jgi:hypothetical protein
LDFWFETKPSGNPEERKEVFFETPGSKLQHVFQLAVPSVYQSVSSGARDFLNRPIFFVNFRNQFLAQRSEREWQHGVEEKTVNWTTAKINYIYFVRRNLDSSCQFIEE